MENYLGKAFFKRLYIIFLTLSFVEEYHFLR